MQNTIINGYATASCTTQPIINDCRIFTEDIGGKRLLSAIFQTFILEIGEKACLTPE